MPNFNCPLPCEVSSLVSDSLMAVIQQSICDEYEAAFRYRVIASKASDSRAKKLFEDIAREEIVHVGEFQQLLKTLFVQEDELVKEGIREAEEKLKNVSDENKPEETIDEVKDKLVSEIVKETKKDNTPIKRKIKIVRA